MSTVLAETAPGPGTGGLLPFAQATLLYLPTTFVLPQVGLILFLALSLFYFNSDFDRRDWLFLVFLIFIAANSTLGIALGQANFEGLLGSNGIIGSVTLLAVYFSSRTLDNRVWYIFLGFILLETTTVFLQLSLSVRYFFDAQAIEVPSWTTAGAYQIEKAQVLYRIRPFGLSIGSSPVALKMITGLTLATILPMARYKRAILIGILMIGLFVTFKRACLFGAFGYAGLMFLYDIHRNGWCRRHTVSALLTIFLGYQFLSNFLFQFFRGLDLSLFEAIELLDFGKESGRGFIWEQNFQFILDNLLLGNYSSRYVFEGLPSHNSFIALVSMHGLIGSVLFAGFILRRLAEWPARFFCLSPLLLTSVFHEGVFWYASAQDVLLFYVLTSFRGPLFQSNEPDGSAPANR